MGIIDDIVVNTKSAAEAVGKKAGQIVDLSKLRVSIAEINSEINRKYQELGQFVYHSARSTFEGDVEVEGRLSEIDELIVQQETVSRELIEKQNKAKCPGCGNLSPVDSAYCSKCGSKI